MCAEQKLQSRLSGNEPATGNSARVHSSQDDIHPRLATTLDRHMSQPWKQPLHAPTVKAFEAVLALLSPGESKRLVFDSGCGTGASSRLLARHWPDSLVIGIDRSAARLGRGGLENSPWRGGNLVLVQAELETFWRLAWQAGWRVWRHYLLYPNPSPKPSQLQRRWHAHPVFPSMLALGGQLVMRTNWDIYAREFAFALNRTGCASVILDEVGEADAVSPFERKYRLSAHDLFEVRADLREWALPASVQRAPDQPGQP